MSHKSFEAFAALEDAWDGVEIFPGTLFERQVKDAKELLDESLALVNAKLDDTGTHQKIVDAALNLINSWVQVFQDPKKIGTSEQETLQIKERHLIFTSFVAGYMASNLSDITSITPDAKAKAVKAMQSHMRALEGASKGGKSSGISRRKNSSLPAPSELAIKREMLIKSGHSERNVASILARHHNCTPEAIRAKLRSIKRN